jgi:tetratricopeptide (TPR) repeat protein
MRVSQKSEVRKQKPEVGNSVLRLLSSVLLILFCIFLFVGCQEKMKSNDLKSSKKDDIGKISNEQQKADLLKKIERKFENPDAHYELGKLYQEEGLWNQAEYQYNISLGFKPSNRDAQAALVKVMTDSGNQAKASNYSDIFINQAAGSAAELLKLAIAFQKQYLDEQAMTCYQQALRLAPNSAKINRQIGYYYLSKGEKEQARSYLSRSFDLNSDQPEVAGELGRLGVEVKIPRKTEKNTKKLDEIVVQSDQKVEQ